MAEPIVLRTGEGWEVVNDDGFIYKRRIKERKSISQAPKRLPVLTQPKDLKESQRRRKKAALQQIKARYLEEISAWETIFQNLESSSQNLNQFEDVHELESSQTVAIDMPKDKCETMLERLSCQVEKLECCMEFFTNLCCEAEHLGKCFSGDQVFYKSYEPSWFHALQCPDS